MTTENHPVWGVYDRLRTARLNAKYYARRMETKERWNFAIELVLLVSAPSSAVAGLWFWNTDVGRLGWKYLGIIAAIAAVLKPVLGLTKRIKEYEGILSGYRVLDFDLVEIKTLIEQRQKYDAPLQSDFKRALQRERLLVARCPETRENHRIKHICEIEVLRELPLTAFFIPEG